MYSEIFSERNHGLTLQFINMERLRRFLILSILETMKEKRKFYGRELKCIIEELLNQQWSPSRSIYETLNKMEQEGFITSYWTNISGGSNTKHKRIYSITDSGIQYYFSMYDSEKFNLNKNISILKKCLHYVWGNEERDLVYPTDEYISSTLFHMLFVLKFLNIKKDGSYLEKILDNSFEEVDRIYKPSKRPVFQSLNLLEELGYITSCHSSYNDSTDSKKRHIRIYSLSKEGREMFKFLISPKSGIKNQILDTIQIINNILNITCGNKVEITNKIESIKFS